MVLLTGPSRLSVTRKLTEFCPRESCCWRPKAKVLEYVIFIFACPEQRRRVLRMFQGIVYFYFLVPQPLGKDLGAWGLRSYYLAHVHLDFVGAGVAFYAYWHMLVPFFCFWLFLFRCGTELGAPGSRIKN